MDFCDFLEPSQAKLTWDLNIRIRVYNYNYPFIIYSNQNNEDQILHSTFLVSYYSSVLCLQSFSWSLHPTQEISRWLSASPLCPPQSPHPPDSSVFHNSNQSSQDLDSHISDSSSIPQRQVLKTILYPHHQSLMVELKKILMLRICCRRFCICFRFLIRFWFCVWSILEQCKNRCFIFHKIIFSVLTTTSRNALIQINVKTVFDQV